MRAFLDNSGLLVTGTVLALVWSNADPDSYDRVAHGLHFLVNDIGMAFFFALAAKEVVEATAPGGALHSPRRSGVPLIAAVGGMAGPIVIYLWLVLAFNRPELTRGWAIPCATDIAFSYLVARFIFGPTHPGIPFLLLMAIADDALGLVILAAIYPTGPLRPVAFILLLSGALSIAWVLRRRGTRNFWPFVLGAGLVSWTAFFRGGLHPALALVPVVPFLPRASRHPDVFVEASSGNDALHEFERWWKMPVHGILFFFGFVNAGVRYGSMGAGTWIVLAAIIIGKPLGIVAATVLSVRAGFHWPHGVTWRDLIVLGVIAGIGFTVALFFATAAFPEGELLDQAKMGALLSLSASICAGVVAWFLRVGPRSHQPSSF